MYYLSVIIIDVVIIVIVLVVYEVCVYSKFTHISSDCLS